jgi:hypothetical protein
MKRGLTRGTLLLALLLVVSGCASLPAQLCSGSQKSVVTAELLFGRKIGDRVGVSEQAFERFVDTEMTPRFPDGLTVLSASGQWRDTERRTTVREPSKVVHIVLPGAADDQARLDAIIAAYKTRFRQQAVGLVTRPACAAF